LICSISFSRPTKCTLLSLSSYSRPENE
jgi:hypothetical protein